MTAHINHTLLREKWFFKKFKEKYLIKNYQNSQIRVTKKPISRLKESHFPSYLIRNYPRHDRRLEIDIRWIEFWFQGGIIVNCTLSFNRDNLQRSILVDYFRSEVVQKSRLSVAIFRCCRQSTWPIF